MSTQFAPPPPGAGVHDNYWANLPVAADFAQFLEICKRPTPEEFIKSREGFTDRNGSVHMVDYVEWHYVADFLDKVWPEWSCSVQGTPIIVGNAIAVTVNLKIGSAVRSGVGTGDANKGELGVKKAEHDALKRAAVKYGIARDLYQDDDSGPIARSSGPPVRSTGPVQRPANAAESQAALAAQAPLTRAVAPPQPAQAAVAANAPAAVAQPQQAQSTAAPQRQQTTQQGQQQGQYKKWHVSEISDPYARKEGDYISQAQYNLAEVKAHEKKYARAFDVAVLVWPFMQGQVDDINVLSKKAASALIDYIQNEAEEIPF